jgi:hypothetical protein
MLWAVSRAPLAKLEAYKVQTFVPKKSTRFLDPDHARIASEAFEAALRSLDGKASTLSSHRLRHLLASFIVERVMQDETDVVQLALEAVESLDGLEEASA